MSFKGKLYCKCGHCNGGFLLLQLTMAIGELSCLIGKEHTIIVNSGYRCPYYNGLKSVGGRKGSYHTQGMALDIRCSGIDVRDLFVAAQQVEALKGLGIYLDEGFIHVDIRPNRARFGYKLIDHKRVKLTWSELKGYLID